MCKQYILQPTESSPGTGNSSPRGNEWQLGLSDTQPAVSICAICLIMLQIVTTLDRVHGKTWKWHQAHTRYCLKTASEIVQLTNETT